MIKFNADKLRDSIKGALALRPKIEEIVDSICDSGYKNICWFGIGGTFASAHQAYIHMKESTEIEVMYENAAEYLTTGNRRIGEGTIVIISSVTGSTEEMVKGVDKLKASGAKVFGFIDKETAPLAKTVDYVISYPENEQLKFFMVADRFLYNKGEFEDYHNYYQEMDQYLADALVQVEIDSDDFGREFAEKHHDDSLHYFVGAGNQMGATYSYAMCYWEEQHWIRTKSIHAAEFFHGMFEIVDRDTNVTVFIGEDSQRPLAERVANFLPQICGNYTIIDTKDQKLEGISEKNRGSISHLVMMRIANRIDRHIERINRHPMDIRRYYRQLDY